MKDELVLLSYPGPDRSVRLDQLRAGRAMPRRYRNRRIGEFLKELEFTEGRSTGIPKILRAMSKNGSPPAEFEFDEDHSYFQVRLPVHPQAAEAVTGHVTPQVTDQVTDQVQRLLEALQGEMSRSEFQEGLALRQRVNFRVAYLQPALEAGLVEMTNPDNPRSSNQKYRLTAKGRGWLAEHGKRGGAA
jgi:ATP-dependent DNA helicase RecG